MLYILPGMGANSSMYTSYDEWNTLEGVKFIDWPIWSGEKSLRELAERLIRIHKISKEDTIVGSSLGGMIAVEIAKLVDAKKVILIGSAAEPSEVNKFLLKLTPLVSITPIKFIQFLTGKYDSHLLTMFRETDGDFIRNMCLAIKSWPGSEAFARISRIHGRNDSVIRCPETANVIQNGGHLIAMTHAKECTDLLKEQLALE